MMQQRSTPASGSVLAASVIKSQFKTDVGVEFIMVDHQTVSSMLKKEFDPKENIVDGFFNCL